MNMVKKVADAIRQEMLTNERWHAETIAKAAIEAMKEPTEEIIDSGLRATAVHLSIEGSQLTVNRAKMKARYQAMIQAVLKE